MQTSKIIYLKQGAYKIDKDNPQFCLGKGSFGKVFKGYDTINNHWVAVKIINIQMMEEYEEEMKEVILNQINVMRKFSKKLSNFPCENLVKLHDCFRSDKSIYIVMQFCENGTLFDELKLKKQYKEPEIIEIAKQLLEGLAYLQKMGIAHRDLKPQNIFITQNQSSKKVYKIGDFGFAARKASFNDILGTYQYMAPEIFKRQQYTSKVDIWSLGITIHQLLFNQFFYSGKNKWEIEDKIKAIDYSLTEEQSNKISTQMQNFLKLCLTKNQSQRPSASELLGSQLFNTKQQNESKSVFSLLKLILKKCKKLVEMAQQFERFQKQTGSKKKTIFAQLYLLKFAYCQMNRTAYTIMNKCNYINIPSDMFDDLIDEKNGEKYQALNELCQKIWQKSTLKFTQKYTEFSSIYLQKFSPHDKELVVKTINDEPYDEPETQIFVNELKKWIRQIDSSSLYSQFGSLKIQCQKIVSSFQQISAQ